MRVVLAVLFTLAAFPLCVSAQDSQVLFPSDRFKIEDVQVNGVDVRLENGTLVCRQSTTGEWPNFVLNTEWNAAKYPHLVIEAENLGKELVRFYLRFLPQRPDGAFSSQPYIDIDAAQKVRSDVSLVLTDSPLQPEVIRKLKGIRGYPGDTKRRSRPPQIVDAAAPLAGTVKQIVFAMYQNKIARTFKITRIEALAVLKKDVEKTETLPAFVNYSAEKFFPFIDKYGQFIHAEWQGKTRTDADMSKSLDKELADLDAHRGPADWNQYGGWTKGPRQEATGHFYVKKINEKWWFVDPEGCLWWSHGPVRVTPSCAVTPLDDREFYFKELPASGTEFAPFYETYDNSLFLYYVKRNIKRTYDFSAANAYRKYGKDWRSKYSDMSHRRLRSWGMNTIGNCSDLQICLARKTPYTDRFELKSPFIEGSRDAWWKFNDPFHPEFRTDLRRQLLERKEQIDDPWCFGYFVDNEIAWGGPADLAKWTLSSPASQPAKIEFARRLKEKYSSIEKLNEAWKSRYTNWDDLLRKQEPPDAAADADCQEFSRAIAEEYYKNIRDEFKKAAPHKLYMGCRFAGNMAPFLDIAAKYSDIISYNIYTHTLDNFKLPDGIDKPVIIGEFHFGALDRGLFHPTLVQVENQKARGEAYYRYVESALRHPNFIGVHWHQYADQAATGRFDGENFQNGFLDVCDTPYPETIEKIREIGYKMYEVRFNSVSEKKD
ncbi:MAG: beta-galactosidase [Planctomycetaceae bacterium]|nr:beta-galactosidase [Planctomycetaceae bacterium]